MNVGYLMEQWERHQLWLFGVSSFIAMVAVLFIQFDAASAYFIVPGILGLVLQSWGICFAVLGCQLIIQRSPRHQASFAPLAAIEGAFGEVMASLSLHTALAGGLEYVGITALTIVSLFAFSRILGWHAGMRKRFVGCGGL